MLSPGECYQQVPTRRPDNLEWRAFILRKGQANKRNRERYQEVCAHDILFYLNTFAWTYNPRGDREGGLPQRVIPFITYPFQNRATLTVLDHIDRQRDLVVEKSRDMGASWISLYCMEWLFHFVPYTTSLMVSRVWDLVDGNTSDSLFWKIDFLHKHLPEWLTPKMTRTRGFFENRDNDATMTGQATTEKVGVGGRATVAFFDEFSRVDNADMIRDGTADVADCRIFNSTHTGPGTTFHGLCTNGMTSKLVMHWTDHPVKSMGAYRYDTAINRVVSLDTDYEYPDRFQFITDGTPGGGPKPGVRSPWYDYECRRRGSPRAVAMDLDIDIYGSTTTWFDPMMLTRLQAECVEPVWQGDVKVSEAGVLESMERSKDGPLKLWLQFLPTGERKPIKLVLGCDVSTGLGATNSCISGIDVRLGEKVLEWVSPHVDPKRLAKIARALATAFEDEDGEPARIIWEHHGPGCTFAAHLLELGFRNIYWRTAEMPHTMENKVSERPGWTSSPELIDALLDEYRSALSLKELVNWSVEALEECRQFKYDMKGHCVHSTTARTEDPRGARYNHGDIVMADAMAWKLARGKATRSLPPQKKEIPYGSLAYRRQLHEDKRKMAEEW